MAKPPAPPHPPPGKPASPAAPRAPASKADAGREARLAAALRSNLRRRKSASRLMGSPRNAAPADEGSDQ
jgi:hypothetical protein